MSMCGRVCHGEVHFDLSRGMSRGTKETLEEVAGVGKQGGG